MVKRSYRDRNWAPGRSWRLPDGRSLLTVGWPAR